MGAITNLVFNAIFILNFKSIGAAIATTIAETVVTAVQMYFIKNEFDTKEILKMSLKYIIAGLIMFITIFLLNKTIFDNLSTISRMTLDITIGIIVYLLGLFLLKDEFLIKNINRIKLRGSK